MDVREKNFIGDGARTRWWAVNAKSPKWEHIWHERGSARRPMWLEQSPEGETVSYEGRKDQGSDAQIK